MEVAAVAIQQAMGQNNMAMAMVRHQAQMQQAIVNMVAESAHSAAHLGQSLDVSA